MGRKGKRNAKRLRAIAAINSMRVSSGRALKKLKEKRGNDTERIGGQISNSLLSKRLIRDTAKAKRWSFMDVVLKTDRVIWRLGDGMPVPIQFKSSPIGFENRAKYEYFKKRFGSLPVFMIITPQDTDLKKLEEDLLRKVNSWNGSFYCEEWQFKHSKFFDFEHHPNFGTLKRRKMIFFSNKRREEEKSREQQKEKIKSESLIALQPQLV